jgi:isoleucyl-tRNA synthetase
LGLQELGPKLPADVLEILAQPGIKAAFAIWTTTPWTIPANLAVAVNADLDYCLVKAEVRMALAWQPQLMMWLTWSRILAALCLIQNAALRTGRLHSTHQVALC